MTGQIEEFWALRDLDFEIKRGELVSIIGHNGAGKSTLLKILSRITEPTEGRVEINGRVNSLLEVGTGFHPELSGRENIFLNGAILGMSRAEMRRRFDEIVEFSGVAKFIDTPVKRYSVGMYVRLAFAVAAHLEAEILVVDEVLSVGDAEFQSKCINRMSEVAGSGRTVLFVSHNFAAVRALTKRSIVLEGGKLAFDGPVEAGLTYYTSTLGRGGIDRNWGRGKDATLVSAKLLDENGNATDHFTPGTALRLQVVVDTTGMPGMSLTVVLRDQHNLPVGYYSSDPFSSVALPTTAGPLRMHAVARPTVPRRGRVQHRPADHQHGDHPRPQGRWCAAVLRHRLQSGRCRLRLPAGSGRRPSRAAAERAAALQAAVRCGDPDLHSDERLGQR